MIKTHCNCAGEKKRMKENFDIIHTLFFVDLLGYDCFFLDGNNNDKFPLSFKLSKFKSLSLDYYYYYYQLILCHSVCVWVDV